MEEKWIEKPIKKKYDFDYLLEYFDDHIDGFSLTEKERKFIIYKLKRNKNYKVKIGGLLLLPIIGSIIGLLRSFSGFFVNLTEHYRTGFVYVFFMASNKSENSSV